MKIYSKLLMTACTAAFLSSCTDLDVNVDSQYTQYPTNEIAVEAKMSDVYFQLRGVFGRRYMEAMSLSSDEYTAVSYGGGWYDSGAYAHPSLHNFGYEDSTIDWMGVITSGISKANKVIMELGGNEAGAVVASPRAIRAYFTYLLMECWGDAPIMDHVVADDEQIDRSPRADVARWIEKELLDVIPQLTAEVSENTYGKPTRWMAEALLAKIYINWPVYTAASVDQYDATNYRNEKLGDLIALCDDIIKSGKFNLGSMPYAEKFGPKNSWKVEDFIYAMPYDTYTEQGMQYGRAKTYKKGADMKPSYYGMNLSSSCGGYVTLTPEFSDLFDVENGRGLEGDQRNDLIIGGQVYVYDPATLKPTTTKAKDMNGKDLVLTKGITLLTEGDDHLDVGDNAEGYRQGWRSVKFFVIDEDFRNGRNQSNDLPIFRYADILLMKAEAILRGGAATNGDTPQSLFNQIRAYVTAPTLDRNPTLDELYDERGREFFDENWRRNDMIRFGHFEDEWFPHYKGFTNANFDKTRRIFPLHKDMMNTNPNWKQNPGY